MSSAGLAARRARRAGVAAGCLAVTILTVLTGALSGPAAAAARPLSGCTTTTGVIVGVDFGHWGGPVLRSCGTTPTTGFALLNQGGWRTTGTDHDGPGFICRIGYTGYRHDIQYPTPAQQACVQTPPGNAYWAFWQAGPGQATWTYSLDGALGYRPRPGSVALWVYGGTNLAGTAGSALPAITPGRLRAPRPGPAAAGSTPAIVNAPPVILTASASSGSARPTLLAVVLVLVLAAAAYGAASRRRETGR